MMSLRVVKSSFYVSLGVAISVQILACGNPHYPKKKAAAPSAEEQQKQNDSLVKTPQPSPGATPSVNKTPTPSPSVIPSAKPTAKPTVVPSATPSAKPSPTPSAKPSSAPSAKPSAKPAAPVASHEDMVNENKLASCERLEAFVAPAETKYADAIDGTEGVYALEEARIQQGLLQNGKWVVLTQLASPLKDAPAKEICSDLLSLGKGKVVIHQISLPQTISRQNGAVGALAELTAKMGSKAGATQGDALAVKLGTEPKPSAKPVLINEIGLKSRKKGWDFWVTPIEAKRRLEVFMSFQDSATGKLFTVKALYQLKQ